VTRASVILLALLAAPCGAAPGRIPVREVQEGYRRGDVELILHPLASFGDEGSSYAPNLLGRYVAAAIPISSATAGDPPLYVYSARSDDFTFVTTLPGYRAGRARATPYVDTIARAIEPLYPDTPGACAPALDLRWVRRLSDAARAAAGRNPTGAFVAVCVALVVLAAVAQVLASAAVSLIDALSSALVRHRLVSHANRALRARSAPRRRKP
jgi:hypothetical protein